jgi:hypothetical protein
LQRLFNTEPWTGKNLEGGAKMQKVYDLLWKKSEENGKAVWEKVGIMLEKDNGKRSLKLDLMPMGSWDGWLVVSERKTKETTC